jgi:hypothetical protein
MYDTPTMCLTERNRGQARAYRHTFAVIQSKKE